MPERRSEQLARALRALQLQAVHRLTRLQAHPAAGHLTHGLAARIRAAQRTLAQDARLEVESVRVLAALDAAKREDRQESLLQEIGRLRAERTRVNARLAAEQVALYNTQRLLDLRLEAALDLPSLHHRVTRAVTPASPRPQSRGKRAGTRLG